MNCKCGAIARIIDTRQDQAQRTTKRRYRCTDASCGARWVTVEREVVKVKETTT